MKKIAINTKYGGFRLSAKAEKMLYDLGVEVVDYNSDNFVDLDDIRDNETLIKVVETLGGEASGEYSRIEVVTIPDNATDWMINEYDGYESVLYVVDGKIRFAY